MTVKIKPVLTDINGSSKVSKRSCEMFGEVYDCLNSFLFEVLVQIIKGFGYSWGAA